MKSLTCDLALEMKTQMRDEEHESQENGSKIGSQERQVLHVCSMGLGGSGKAISK
jgi:hypothetical protein